MLGGQTAGGLNFNVVPGSCSFTVDRRINPEEDFDREKDQLISLITQAPEPLGRVEVEILQEGRSAGTAAGTSLGVALSRSVEQVTGAAPRFEMCPGLLET